LVYLLNVLGLAAQSVTYDAFWLAAIFGVILVISSILTLYFQQKNYAFLIGQQSTSSTANIARLEERIKELETKVRELIVQVENLQQENIKLQKLNNKLETDNRALIDELSTYLSSRG